MEYFKLRKYKQPIPATTVWGQSKCRANNNVAIASKLRLTASLPAMAAGFSKWGTFCFIYLIGFGVTLGAQVSRPDDPTEHAPKKDSKDSVTMYLDFAGGHLGHSPYRRLRLQLELSALQYYRSYPVAEPTGWSTAVFVTAETERKLRLGKLPISQFINSRGGIYYLKYKGMHIAFGLEAPSSAVFDIIAKTYKNLPEIKKLVEQRYLGGYVIRIYQAENVLEPENQQVTYPEAVLAATIIGDREQWLWGIHDGRDLLNWPMQPMKPMK